MLAVLLGVNSSRGGGSVRAVPRRRSKLTRPGEHLAEAAAAHARLTSGEPHPHELATPTAAAAEPSAHSLAAQAQKRSDGGKFA